MNPETLQGISEVAYLIASVLFIFGLKLMTHPRSAARGNLLSALAMFIAVVVTLLNAQVSLTLVFAGVLVGGAIGLALSARVEMTKMPELVALFNGFGGIATVFVAAASLLDPTLFLTPTSKLMLATHLDVDPTFDVAAMISTEVTLLTRSVIGTPLALSGIIGAVTFSGSLIACFKLLGLKGFWKPIELPGHQGFNAALLATAVVVGALIFVPAEMALETRMALYLVMTLAALALGVTLVLPIGGADMPVVVALLNSYSGLAAAAAGFVVGSMVLIISGSLVGASGLILTAIMCKAMNRSLTNVLFGKIDASGVSLSADEVYEGKITRTSADEVAMLFEDARKVVIVPGYGLAVAQAQFAVRDLFKELEGRGIDVQFAIHPVAGRMPGHMNVLLAEVDIPYEKLREMEEINAEFEETDIAVVLGANDVVNPDGRDNPDSPIAGMPILDVDKARTVVVVKRSLSPGFAGIPNPLFAADNCLMYFADGKKAALELVSATKEL